MLRNSNVRVDPLFGPSHGEGFLDDGVVMIAQPGDRACLGDIDKTVFDQMVIDVDPDNLADHDAVTCRSGLKTGQCYRVIVEAFECRRTFLDPAPV